MEIWFLLLLFFFFLLFCFVSLSSNLCRQWIVYFRASGEEKEPDGGGTAAIKYMYIYYPTRYHKSGLTCFCHFDPTIVSEWLSIQVLLVLFYLDEIILLLSGKAKLGWITCHAKAITSIFIKLFLSFSFLQRNFFCFCFCSQFSIGKLLWSSSLLPQKSTFTRATFAVKWRNAFNFWLRKVIWVSEMLS